MSIYKIRKKELIRFLVGGGSAVMVDYIIYRFFMQAGLDRNFAKAISFIGGSIVGFIINKLWTFESKRFSRQEIIKYIILYSCTSAINTEVNRLVLLVAAVELLAFLCATGASTVLNFIGQKYFVFKK